MNPPRFLFLLCASLAPLAARAASSANYSLGPAALDNAGLTTTSANYHSDTSAGAGAASSSVSYTSRTGFVGQLNDGVGLSIHGSAPLLTVNEGGSIQLSASLVYDDQSTSPLPPDALTWSVLSGPVAGVSAAGLASAGTVYQNAAAVVSGVYQTFSATQEISVLNTNGDNFGTYANDGLPDAWQVQYFGLPPNAMAAPSASPRGNGFNNLQEFAFGMNPTLGTTSPVTWNGTTNVAGGAPTQLATSSSGTFTFRAVYARRKDYVAAQLSYTVEFSGDLLSWKASTATPALLADDGLLQAVSVPYPFFVAGKKARYFRVKVEIP
ncbi:MAG: hypothetical protein WCK77_13640 [Verrucomicrobiota bacterium]